jgi:hypothetical protein
MSVRDHADERAQRVSSTGWQGNPGRTDSAQGSTPEKDAFLPATTRTAQKIGTR